MNGPVFYETLYDERVNGYVNDGLEHAREAVARPLRDFEMILRHVAGVAYAAGLRDGFAQGVAAESNARASEGAAPKATS
jgi:hypothetical protein